MNKSLFPASRSGIHEVFLRFLIVFLALSVPALAAGSTPAINVTGNWTGSFASFSVNGDSGPITVTLNQAQNNTLTGFLSVPGSSCLAGGGAIFGTINGNKIQFGNIAIAGGAGPNAISFTGTIDSATSMSGQYAVQAPCATDVGSWQLTVGSPVATICPDCVHAGSPITANTLAMWSALSPATLIDSLLTQDSAGVFHVGNYLTFGGTSGGVASVGPGAGLTGHDTGSVGPNIGVFGEADGDNGAGVFGYAPACTASSPCTPSPGSPNAGFTAGVRGVADGTSGFGVRGFASSNTGVTRGMEGRVNSPDGRGAEGFNLNTGTTGTPIGVFGRTLSAKGTAVWGNATTTATIADNTTTGVLGSGKTGVSGFANVGDQGVGVWGANFSSTGWTRGVLAQIFSPSGEALAVEAPQGGNLIVGRSGPTYAQVFHVENNGNFHSAGAFLPGGADFAESMRVEGSSAEYAPGDVLVIDRTSTRQLTLSEQPYSQLVAGIYSTKPGVLASPGGSSKVDVAKEVPLAVVGIVPCKVSAENGAIGIGDLLVTASKAGYAMKGTDRGRMLGAIVGKALEPLREGTGIIQVLVTLQ